MHRTPKLRRYGSFPITNPVALSTFTIYDFLAPTVALGALSCSTGLRRFQATAASNVATTVDALFYTTLSRATTCPTTRHRRTRVDDAVGHSTHEGRLRLQESVNIGRSQCRSFSHSAGLSSRRRPVKITKHWARESEQASGPSAWDFFDSNTLEFAKTSRIPVAFFQDLNTLHEKVGQVAKEHKTQDSEGQDQTLLQEQTELLESVRELEEKLRKARATLSDSLRNPVEAHVSNVKGRRQQSEQTEVVLTKDDYKNMVDLYHYTSSNRFDPESPHSSPTPTFLEDYAFKLSEDFASPQAFAEFYDNEEEESPLKEVERMLKSRQIREITVFKSFVDLLLDTNSSNAALFHAYKRLPQPGVSFLPIGIVRLLLQRMSTPWQKSEKSMIRYLSLIDEMQKANLPIHVSEWASAIYLAGRSFGKVTDSEVNSAMNLWKHMEEEAGVKARDVTFNILFDIAVRANKFPLAQMILKEMHNRGLHLNRLGRVSVIYYHGLRGDGDAVRKAYRDFVDAGEVVDTLVLTCVMAALYNAQEPAAAEQIYERMKSLHVTTRREKSGDGSTAYYRRYPGPGSGVIDRKLAANSLGRTLLFSSRLKDLLPDHHQALQQSMPLRPTHITFRTMISYHANVSGNLNRITVLISEMSEIFGLSLQSIHYQLLFKGFTLHGGTQSPDATWSIKRLQMTWESCLYAIKGEQRARRKSRGAINVSTPQLPATEVVGDPGTDRLGREPGAPLKRLSEWDDFVLDLAAFPHERRKHIERIHAELFDEEQERKQPLISNPFSRRSAKETPPRGQEHYYPLGERELDEQEGEYVLPSPILAIDPSRTEFHNRFFPERDSSASTEYAGSRTIDKSASEYAGPESSFESAESDNASAQDSDADADEDATEEGADLFTKRLRGRDYFDESPFGSYQYQMAATRPLVCWLLRAYSRSTGSREKVAELWNSVRKVWRSPDPNDQASVIRVLRRCLKDCDRYGPPM